MRLHLLYVIHVFTLATCCLCHTKIPLVIVIKILQWHFPHEIDSRVCLLTSHNASILRNFIHPKSQSIIRANRDQWKILKIAQICILSIIFHNFESTEESRKVEKFKPKSINFAISTSHLRSINIKIPFSFTYDIYESWGDLGSSVVNTLIDFAYIACQNFHQHKIIYLQQFVMEKKASKEWKRKFLPHSTFHLLLCQPQQHNTPQTKQQLDVQYVMRVME